MSINIASVDNPEEQALLTDLLELEQKRQNGESIEVTKAISNIAEKHKFTLSKVRGWYYGKVKGQLEGTEEDLRASYEKQYQEYQDAENLTEIEKVAAGEKEENSTDSIIESGKLSAEAEHLANSLKTPELRPLKPPYKTGEILEVRVERILQKVGAICKTMDGYAYQGLVHISRIADKYVEDIHDHFTEGQIIKARFVKTNMRNELELSTMGIKQDAPEEVTEQSKPKNPPLNTLADKLVQVKEQLYVTPEESEEHHVLKKISNEEEKIIKYMNGIVGTVTPAAREELFKVIEEHGIFAWTLKMTDVAKDFSNDLGLMFVQTVRKKLEEDGL